MTHDPGDLSMKPSRDELAQRQQARGNKPVRPAGQPPSRPAPPAAGGASTGVLWFLILLMLLGTAGGGWYLWDKIERLQASLGQSTQALASSEQALSGLQQSLDNRDKTLSQTGEQMAADIKDLNSEVRKLWDVANKRNKVALDEHDKQIAKLQADLKAQSTAVDKKVAAATAASEGLQGDLAALQTTGKDLTSALEQQKSELARLKTQLATPADLEDRITTLEVAIKAIDAHRKQINGRLDQLDQQLGQLYKKPTTP